MAVVNFGNVQTLLSGYEKESTKPLSKNQNHRLLCNVTLVVR